MDKVKCLKCSYEWETKSEMMHITCPNCQYKNKFLLKKEPKNLKEKSK